MVIFVQWLKLILPLTEIDLFEKGRDQLIIDSCYSCLQHIINSNCHTIIQNFSTNSINKLYDFRATVHHKDK